MKVKTQGRTISEKDLEIRRKINAQKHRKKQRRKIITFYIFLVISIVLISLFFIIHNFFKISKIEIEGSKKYTYSQVKKILDIKISDNIFRYKSGVISQKIKDRLIYIDEVRVVKKLPNKILITLVDAIPRYFIQINDKYLILSKNMRILEEKEFEKIEDGYVINSVNNNGTNIVKITVNKKDKIKQDRTLTEILGLYIKDKNIGSFVLEKNQILSELIKVLEKNQIKDITKIDLTTKSNIKILYQDRINILLGNIDQIDYKIKFIKKIIEKNLDKNTKGILDATSVQKNSKIYFTPDKELPTMFEIESDTEIEETQNSELDKNIVEEQVDDVEN